MTGDPMLGDPMLGEPVPGDPRDYARALAAGLATASGALRAAYLHGSAALGGWDERRSDVDVLFVVADNVTAVDLAAARDLLVASAPGGPGRGLECSVVSAGQARRPAPPWPFLLHVSSDGGGQIRHCGDDGTGDADLIMHYAVCRAAGLTLVGPPPGDCIGPVARPVILGYLADELGWGLASAPESYAVLNACRALAFLADGRIMSKVAGGLAAIESGRAPAGLVRSALDQQQARSAERPPGPEAAAFVRGVITALSAQAADRRPGAGWPA